MSAVARDELIIAREVRTAHVAHPHRPVRFEDH